MKLFRQLLRDPLGPACAHGLFSLSIDTRPATGIGAFGLPRLPARAPDRARFLFELRARLARRSWSKPA